MQQKPGSAVQIVEAKPISIRLTDMGIATIQHNIQQAERLVTSVLEPEVDFGLIPGLPGKCLFDPGAGKIMAAFNSYADHEVIHHQEEDTLVSWTIQAKIINRDTQMVVGTGVGAASTREVKYRYRWVPDPQNYGYGPEEIKALKTRSKKNKQTGEIYGTEYRIENPEYGELVHTLLAMASKRAEVDAVKSLPGVGSALKKLFGGVAMRPHPEGPDWAMFWGQMNKRGLTEDEARRLLGVRSIKDDWVGRGRTLEEALQVIDSELKASAYVPPVSGRAAGGGGQGGGGARQGARVGQAVAGVGEPTQADLADLTALMRYVNRRWGLQPTQVLAELNISRFSECVEPPRAVYQRLRAAREEPTAEEETLKEEGLGEPPFSEEDLPF